MNKKVMGFIIAAIVVVGAGFYFLTNNSNSANKGGEMSVTHALSETPVLVKKNPKKIAVFDYGVLDIIDTLGGDVTGVAKASLTKSLDKYNDAKYEDIGTLFEPNYETLAAMKPDVILISGRQSDLYDDLSAIAPTIYFEVSYDDYMKSFKDNVTIIAEMLGKEKLAEEKLSAIDKRVETINKTVTDKKSTALITLTNDGEISGYGPSSRFGVIHNAFGFVPVDVDIESTNHGQQLSFEYIVEKNPQYIFVIDRNKAIGKGDDNSKVFENELMKNTEAYKNKHIVFLDEEAWYLASGGIQTTELMLTEMEAVM